MDARIQFRSGVASGGSGKRAAQRTRLNVVLFSGGSGTKTIAEALLKHPQISLKILINAYDDGHSTGRLRRFVPGMLGPSDVRKNVLRLMPSVERSQKNLRMVSEYRFPVNASCAAALGTLHRIRSGDFAALVPELSDAFPLLTTWQSRRLSSFLDRFCDYYREQGQAGRSLDFSDCSLGNLYFTGCYLQQQRDFNLAIQAFSEVYEVDRHLLLNVTGGENLFLAAGRENGSFLLNEAQIVAAQGAFAATPDDSKINELFLVDQETYLTQIDEGPEPAGGWAPLLRLAHRIPALNPRAAEALQAADVIIYGPGTQHSSQFPSYMTAGVAEAVAANTAADKVFVGNIHRDCDIRSEDAGGLARKFLHAMGRQGALNVDWQSVVTHFFLQGTDEGKYGQANYVPFNPSQFTFPLQTVKVRDWESAEGRHSGGYVLDQIRQLVQSRVDIQLEPLHHTVTIVVPVLNEEATVERVLRSLTALDFSSMSISKEVVLVDGGSSDATVQRARSVRNVQVHSLPNGSFGRGRAMRLGIEKARGNLIVFFPGDDEYRAEDLYRIVQSLMQAGVTAITGTRAVKCTDLSGRLKNIYDNNWARYLASKYGGILLSITALLLYNRYVTDVLSSVKGYNAELLHSLELESDGLDLETEIVAKLSRRREYLFEVPVDYKPRPRSAGKKIRVSDGLRALFGLFRFRLQG